MKILSVENQTNEPTGLERTCRAILGDSLELFATADSPTSAVKRLGETTFDLVLLDLELSHGDGFELLSGMSALAAQTIVVSSQTDLAMRAFECGVVDFVQKPVSQERLATAIGRVAGRAKPQRTPEPFIAVRRMGRIDLVPVADLLYVEGSDKYSELVLNNGQRSFYDKCLGRVEATLPRTFVRIHKSYLVRFATISRLHVLKGSRYYAELKNGLRLPVGRSRYGTIKARLI